MSAPKILREGEYTKKDLEKIKTNKIWQIKDIYEAQLRELFEIEQPEIINTPGFEVAFEKFLKKKLGSDKELSGDYIYYPWSGLLFHMVKKNDLRQLRTNRTNNLITMPEQKILGDFTAGIAGLSFGNGIALSLVYTGISDHIKLADTDIFETTNLNRVRVGLKSVSQPKTTVTAQEVYEINPHADVELFTNGLTDENLEKFLSGEKKLDIVFDVVDDLAMKIKLRLAAKAAKVPVVMLTSLEDSILVDIERFDLLPDAEIFHGLLKGITDDLLTKEMSEQDKAKYAMAIVGPEHVSYRNLLSLTQVGKSLVSRPHLYGTVSIVCGLASYIAKRIALGEEMPSMRKHVKFSQVLNIPDNKDDTQEARNELLSRMMKGDVS